MQIEDKKMGSLILRLVERLKDAYLPEKIILYGSYAYGRPDEESDIDLLIIKETSERPVDRRIAVRKLVSDIRRKVPFSSLVITPGELSERLRIGDDFFIEIVNKGEVLYER